MRREENSFFRGNGSVRCQQHSSRFEMKKGLPQRIWTKMANSLTLHSRSLSRTLVLNTSNRMTPKFCCSCWISSKRMHSSYSRDFQHEVVGRNTASRKFCSTTSQERRVVCTGIGRCMVIELKNILPIMHRNFDGCLRGQLTCLER